MNFSFLRSLFAVAVIVMASVSTAFAQQQQNPLSYAVNGQPIVLYAWDIPTTSTTGTVADLSVNSSTWIPGFTIPSASVTLTPATRTLILQYTEASGSAAVLKLKLTGINQFGGTATEVVTMNSTSYYVTKTAFSPRTKVTIQVISASGLNNSDTLDINRWGWGLPEVPYSGANIASIQINGTQQLDGTDGTLATQFAKFDQYGISWNPSAFGQVADDAVLQFQFVQTGTAPNGLPRPGPGTSTYGEGTATAGVAP